VSLLDAANQRDVAATRIGVDQQRPSAGLGYGSGQTQRHGCCADAALSAGHHD
jgi:hypothetical protein